VGPWPAPAPAGGHLPLNLLAPTLLAPPPPPPAHPPQVYREVALAEAADSEATHEAGLRARGHSGAHDPAADAAALAARLEAGLPEGSPLRAAGRKYLDAALANPSWTFAQRRRLVERLIEVAAALEAHPPRTLRGSPFSAALQPGGPPLAPRLSRPPAGRRGRRGTAPGVGVVLPGDLGEAAAAAAAASASG
jgi:hypothetical protein